MGWWNKIFKGSSHRISEAQYMGGYHDDHVREAPSMRPEYKSDYDNEDVDWAIALSLSEEEHWKGKAVETGSHLEEDEQLARATQESLSVSSPQSENEDKTVLQPIPFIFPSHERRLHLKKIDFSKNAHTHSEDHSEICAGCHSEISHNRYLNCMGAVWHPECFRCHACNDPISDYPFSMAGNNQYHKSCYHPKCDVCKQLTPTDGNGVIEFKAHPFWEQKYCLFHEGDGTPRCCSCERMEPKYTTYITLDDGRKLCLECLDSSIMDNTECLPLFLDIQEFYEGLNMKITQQFPLLLVERQALNEAMEGEKSGYHHMPETRGLCLSEEQTVSTIRRRPKIEDGNCITNMIREPYRLTRMCEVTAILILYGLPRVLTGSILAHEMMHAWLRLNGFRTLSQNVEEGICQVLAHMWLESEIMSGSGSQATSVLASSSSKTASSSTSSSSSSGLPKKAARSHFEKKFGEFFKHQIESDTSAEYGVGFRAGNEAVLKYGLRATLKHIKLTGNFPL